LPLVIELKSGDKLIVNGAVVENVGSNTKLKVLNKASLLRGKEVMSESQSRTPATRVYFALQCAYIFPEKRADYLEAFRTYIHDYAEASPSAAPIVQSILSEVRDDQLYRALKTATNLVEHEEELMRITGITLVSADPSSS